MNGQPDNMDTYVTAEVDDELKIAADAIMAVCGESEQEVLSRAYMNYVLKHIEEIPNGDELLHAVYTSVVKQQREVIAPLIELGTPPVHTFRGA
jgi:hypothetical protein